MEWKQTIIWICLNLRTTEVVFIVGWWYAMENSLKQTFFPNKSYIPSSIEIKSISTPNINTLHQFEWFKLMLQSYVKILSYFSHMFIFLSARLMIQCGLNKHYFCLVCMLWGGGGVWKQPCHTSCQKKFF